ncbi:NAD(P)/FAD-dependent oxidoreductase [Marinilongibacter aquaticus]|uniref:NAD(P)/FAD-dependent oxidoreductase n=1 Tax=Marinilongibacter aquaticus TaxID=2975157 RepID=UPI0021BDAACE|nr:FAD/NAD(P)-binding oxidoreductase [Marinilongibacter aquaticus]UBM58527.1 NAD(P)/FAD-dependent oxidoreductase [Marinilongibacter aquaticus]
MKSHHSILIIGGGTAGIMTAAQLLKHDEGFDIAIIEPSNTHYYQPAWTLVGAGTYDYAHTAKPMQDVMPEGVTWIKDFATGFDPENNVVETENKGSVGYDFLIVAPGLVMAPELIEGLPEALERGVAVSNYINPNKVWEAIQHFKGGNALFTQPTTPIKCGGAPQKIAYLAADHFRKSGLDSKTKLIFATPGSVIFGVKPIKNTLEHVLDRYGIHFRPFYAPFKIDPERKVVYFKTNDNNAFSDEENAQLKIVKQTENIVEVPFDLLHLAPPQTAPKFVKESKLVNDAGWLDVDIHSMQHKKFKNVFGLGDVAALPTAKTGAAIRKQVPVVVDNLLKIRRGKEASNHSYNGYSSCPLVTGYGKMVLAEFDYENNFTPDPKLKQMLVFDSSKEHWRLWILKKYILPYLYWNKMLKGQDV